MLQTSIILVLLLQVLLQPFAKAELGEEGDQIDVKKTFVYGHGLQRDAVLPVRYFYIQFADKSGRNLTNSLGKDNIKLEFSTSSSWRVRAWRELLDRNDGSYIVRFRLMETYPDLIITVKYKDSHVADSPYVLKGPFYHEQCHCPEEDGDKWFSDMKCAATHGQIERDLSKFPVIDLNRLRTEGYERFNNRDVCHYSVIDGKAYSRCLDSIQGFKKDIDHWLLSILRKVKLPDVEFFVNTGDWPLIYTFENPFPIVSWCGADNAADITWPTYYATQGILDELRIRPMSMANVQGNSGPVWENKTEKAVFRGMDSNIARLNLIMTRRKMTELYDVGLSRTFYHPFDEEKYGPHNRMSFFDFFKFKYIINIDGTVAAYRLPFLLVGDSLILKQQSPYYEHFYKELSPGVHYVEFKNDLSDLDEKVLWAKSHDEEAQKIAKAGQAYARDNLMPHHTYCYTYLLLKEYAKRQQQKPEVFEGMKLVDQPNDQDSVCDCHRKTTQGKDEL